MSKVPPLARLLPEPVSPLLLVYRHPPPPLLLCKYVLRLHFRREDRSRGVVLVPGRHITLVAGWVRQGKAQVSVNGDASPELVHLKGKEGEFWDGVLVEARVEEGAVYLHDTIRAVVVVVRAVANAVAGPTREHEMRLYLS